MIRAEERTMTNKQAMLVHRLLNLCSPRAKLRQLQQRPLTVEP
jgi:hypothetical protein